MLGAGAWREGFPEDFGLAKLELFTGETTRGFAKLSLSTGEFERERGVLGWSGGRGDGGLADGGMG